MKNIDKKIVISLSLLFLIGCGGGSSSSPVLIMFAVLEITKNIENGFGCSLF